ncbi:MAG TPA: thiamine-phosphate kinase [Candidatus Ratteibacteria bacterium]|nr:thiamine-phosphate kinase [Candidatus Ratteibacteria bacterium]
MKEKEIIEFIRKSVITRSKNIIAGIGDDTAVVKYTKNDYLLLTIDSIVENVHFKLNQATYYQIGKKAIAVNLSDIAAMGGIPLYILISIGLPEGEKETIGNLLNGFKYMAKRYKFEIIGGNLTKSNILFIDVCAVGKVEKKYLKLRNGAKEGDLIYVTGNLGASQIKKHLNIKPRIEESRFLVKNFPISAMIDISDGLSSDLITLSKESNVGFNIFLEKIPLSNEVKKISKTKEEEILHALNDGEDYELLFTIPEKYKNNIPEKINKTKITLIGEITKDREYKGIYKNREINITASGFDHFPILTS